MAAFEPQVPSSDATPGATAQTHVFEAEPTIQAEIDILGALLEAGDAVLDVGCAATGRSARLARRFSPDVRAIDVNATAVARFRARDDAGDIRALVASVTELPFPEKSHDLVLIALHGIDYLDSTQRRGALSECARVLRSGGYLVFNTNNPIGSLLSPRALANVAYLRWRLRHLARLSFLRSSITDLNGLTLHQALPGAVIREAEETGDLRFVRASSRGGESGNLMLLTVLSAAPYYVFRKV